MTAARARGAPDALRVAPVCAPPLSPPRPSPPPPPCAAAPRPRHALRARTSRPRPRVSAPPSPPCLSLRGLPVRVRACARRVCAQETDSVYKGVSGCVVLQDSGKGTALSVSCKQGWRDTVVWNPYGDEGE